MLARLLSSILLMVLIQRIQSRLVPLRASTANHWQESQPGISGPLLWPKPEYYRVDYKHPPYRISLNEDVRIKMTNQNQMMKCDIVKYNVEKYGRILNDFVESIRMKSLINCQQQQQQGFDSSSGQQLWLEQVDIFIEDFHCNDEMHPNFLDHSSNGNSNNSNSNSNSDNNEMYQIDVQPNTGKAILYSKNIWGMIHSLETFSQLLYVNHLGTNDSYDVMGCFEILINVGSVRDMPRFSYRSMMIDTSRHFIPISVLVQNLDAMSFNKMNIFHWHLNDDQSFPFESETFKNFSRLASYNPKNSVYTKRDIKKLVQEARLRGIQVILELDTPAHNSALGKVFPGIMSKCVNEPNQTNIRSMSSSSTTTTTTEWAQRRPTSNIVNPSTESTYQILRQLLLEMRPLLTSNQIHLGMDDVTYECWSKDLAIQKFMLKNKINSFEQLEQYHLQRMIGMVKQFSFNKPIIWQDPFDKNIAIPKETIIQVWKDHKLLDDDPREWKYHVQRIVRQNYSIILSSCYFLSLIKYGQDWQELYECDPHDFNGTEMEKSLVLGGEVCLWTEYIDETNLLSRTWPRASAVAERLWSKMSETNDADGGKDKVDVRLDAQRCRMLRRGIPAQPISTGFCENSNWNNNNHHHNNNNNNHNNNNNNGNNVDDHVTGIGISYTTNNINESTRYPWYNDHSNENNKDNNNNNNNKTMDGNIVELKYPIIMQQEKNWIPNNNNRNKNSRNTEIARTTLLPLNNNKCQMDYRTKDWNLMIIQINFLLILIKIFFE